MTARSQLRSLQRRVALLSGLDEPEPISTRPNLEVERERLLAERRRLQATMDAEGDLAAAEAALFWEIRNGHRIGEIELALGIRKPPSPEDLAKFEAMSVEELKQQLLVDIGKAMETDSGL